jgi:hypothetical protein
LHFEIRETKTEKALNVLQFYPQITDNIAPAAKNLYVYNFSSAQCESSALSREILPLQYKNGSYSVVSSYITSSEFVSFGVDAYDRMNGSSNTFGVYKIVMKLDDQAKVILKFDSTSFLTSRGINAVLDYEMFVKNKRKVYTLYQSPNNNLANYVKSENRGIINLIDNQSHKVEIYLSDYSGNVSKLAFFVKKTKQNLIEKKCNIVYNKNSSLSTEKLNVSFPENCLFFNEQINLTKLSTSVSSVSFTYNLGSTDIPVKSKFQLQFDISNIPENLREKVFAVNSDASDHKSALLGEVNGIYLDVQSTDFGKYYLQVDTTPPLVSLINKKEEGNLLLFFVKIRDYQSGIKNYSVFLNNNWRIVYFDKKRNLLSIYLDKNELEPNSKLNINVEDHFNNSTNFDIVVN